MTDDLSFFFGKILSYQAFVNYNVYEFEVYDLGNYQGISNYWTPVGVVVVVEQSIR